MASILASFLDLASKTVKRFSRSARIETFSDASLTKEYLRSGEGEEAGRSPIHAGVRIMASDIAPSSREAERCGGRDAGGTARRTQRLAALPPPPPSSLDAVADQILDARVAHVGVAAGQLNVLLADAATQDAGVVTAQNGGDAGLQVERVGVRVLRGGRRGRVDLAVRTTLSLWHTQPAYPIVH